MKTGIVLAFILAITGQVLYHVTQKSISPGTHPVISLLMFYLLAAVLTLPLFILFPLQSSWWDEVQKLNWAVYGVALSIVLIEIGFLLAYRAGAELSSAAVLTAAVVAISTFVIGVAFFHEAVSLGKLAGIVLCLAGIGLMTYQSRGA
jgi:drug/metabolite transporter (DMT)-like permease